MSRWKQGATLPPMHIDCFAPANKRVDLSTAETVEILAFRKGTQVWSVVTTGNANGEIDYTLTPDKTATVGTYWIKVRVTWTDENVQYFPPADDYMEMTVTR